MCATEYSPNVRKEDGPQHFTLLQQQQRITKTAMIHSSHYISKVWGIALLLGLIAFLPRCVGLADFFTLDEGFHWVWRVQHFAGAVEDAHWDLTNLTGHPGVTTLWLGTLGRWLALANGLDGPGWAQGSTAYLATLRLPLALVNSLAIVAGYLLLRSLLRPTTALLGVLLWAGSPFLIAHSRLLHLDALLTSLMTLSILLLLLATRHHEHHIDLPEQQHGRARLLSFAALFGSGICAGLALLTKSPSLLLLPTAAVVLLLFSPVSGIWQRVQWSAGRFLFWLVCALLVFWLAWPAMWDAPWQAVGSMLDEITANGARPHHTGNYFLGQPVADPGWLFYPVVVVWRTNPLTLAGLLLFPLALHADSAERRSLLAMAGFVLLFGLAMSLLPKKFDRYLLPIWPMLQIMAAAGLLWGVTWLTRRIALLRTSTTTVPNLFLALVGAVLIGSNLWYHPHYLAYFNPLAGGGATAQQVMLVGWGEGLEQVGAWLRSRPDLTRSQVLSGGPRSLEPFVPVPVDYLNEYNVQQPASYAVVYVRNAQRRESASALDYVQQSPPLYTVTIHGMEYAHVYQPPRHFTTGVDAVFSSGLQLRGFSQNLVNNTLVITPSWTVQTSQPGGMFCFVHVLDNTNRHVAQVDVPVDEGLFATWQAGQQFGSPLQMHLPDTLTAGEYRIVLGVYNPINGTRLPLVQGNALPHTIDGADVIELTMLEVGITKEQNLHGAGTINTEQVAR